MSDYLKSTLFVVLLCFFSGIAQGQDSVTPREVKVLPVFFVPKSQRAPTDDEVKRLMRHLLWSQTRYREMLGQPVTFGIARPKPLVYQSGHDLQSLRRSPDNAAQIVSELLVDLKFNRYTCPYVLLVVVMNPKEDFPGGGGRPLNGGINTGGGIVELSSFALNRTPNFQSTLQHELGHAFGLPHVDVYGYDMNANDSIMSYNPAHLTSGFNASRTPGRLIPEDLRGLALNQRVFPKLRFDSEKHVPQGYSIAELIPLGPMKIPGQPD
jgi:hypothetical protein